jgi:phosphate transport system protein
MENEHIVGKFDDDLDRIKNEILEMGKLVKKQLQGATNALLSFDTDDVDALITTDRRINGMNKTIFRHAEQIIAMRQPMALDLRLALLATSIASELERLGDYAKSTAKRVRKLTENSSGEKTLSLIGEMSRIVQEMLTEVLMAYKNNDIEKAAEIRVRDIDVDELNKKIQKTAIKSIREFPEDTETLVHLILLARNFERAGDHIVNIARQVHQIVTGEDLKASD